MSKIDLFAAALIQGMIAHDGGIPAPSYAFKLAQEMAAESDRLEGETPPAEFTPEEKALATAACNNRISNIQGLSHRTSLTEKQKEVYAEEVELLKNLQGKLQR